MMKPKELFIYHPGTGTVISLSDPVYLIENVTMSDGTTRVEWYLAYEPDKREADLHGRRIDNYNMTNLFFGGAE